jgi:hypothetical protein
MTHDLLKYLAPNRLAAIALRQEFPRAARLQCYAALIGRTQELVNEWSTFTRHDRTMILAVLALQPEDLIR